MQDLIAQARANPGKMTYGTGNASSTVAAEMLKLAAHIIDTKAGHFEPKSFEDHYETALIELLRKKQAGMPIPTVGEEKAAPRVINLMDALRASINASAKKPAAASTGERRPAAKKKTGTR